MDRMDCPHCSTTNIKRGNYFTICVFCKKQLIVEHVPNDKQKKEKYEEKKTNAELNDMESRKSLDRTSEPKRNMRKQNINKLNKLNKREKLSKQQTEHNGVIKQSMYDLKHPTEIIQANTVIYPNSMAKLDTIVGLNSVKDYLKSIFYTLRIQRERQKLGLKQVGSQTLHMIFVGNPGTGKTTIARIVGDILFEFGVLKTNNFIETDRSGLVGKYIGETAIKTVEIINKSLDGVLFIDEAYAIANDASSQYGYGKEAIDTLIKCIEDNRDRLVVILAGYEKEMEKFIDSNPGLRSRFPNVIPFSDYSIDELMQIAEKLYIENDYILIDSARDTLRRILTTAKGARNFSNARYVRNLFEKSVRNHAMRVESAPSLSKKILTEIIGLDLAN